MLCCLPGCIEDMCPHDDAASIFYLLGLSNCRIELCVRVPPRLQSTHLGQRRQCDLGRPRTGIRQTCVKQAACMLMDKAQVLHGSSVCRLLRCSLDKSATNTNQGSKQLSGIWVRGGRCDGRLFTSNGQEAQQARPERWLWLLSVHRRLTITCSSVEEQRDSQAKEGQDSRRC